MITKSGWYIFDHGYSFSIIQVFEYFTYDRVWSFNTLYSRKSEKQNLDIYNRESFIFEESVMYEESMSILEYKNYNKLFNCIFIENDKFTENDRFVIGDDYI